MTRFKKLAVIQEKICSKVSKLSHAWTKIERLKALIESLYLHIGCKSEINVKIEPVM